MTKFILGKKIRVSQFFQEDGRAIPVSIIETGPCYVTQIKNAEKDSYSAIQIGFGQKKEKNIKKPQRGQLEKIKKINNDFNSLNLSYLREVRVSPDEIEKWTLGQEIKVDIFQESEKVKIRGISKGKGFQGWVKRYHFAGGPATHGNKHSGRQRGSIGSSFPERVLKGTKMAGRMGGKRVSIKNLKIIKIIPEENIIAIKGAIPGRRGTLVEIIGE